MWTLCTRWYVPCRDGGTTYEIFWNDNGDYMVKNNVLGEEVIFTKLFDAVKYLNDDANWDISVLEHRVNG